jgi:hypothetical protein
MRQTVTMCQWFAPTQFVITTEGDYFRQPGTIEVDANGAVLKVNLPTRLVIISNHQVSGCILISGRVTRTFEGLSGLVVSVVFLILDWALQRHCYRTEKEFEVDPCDWMGEKHFYFSRSLTSKLEQRV